MASILRSPRTAAERADLRRVDCLAPFDLLQAHYLRHSFAPHAHETYAIGVALSGAVATRHRGARHVMGPGQLLLVNPGELHTGEPACDEGWSYVMCYPGVDLLRAAADGMRGRPGAAPVLPAPAIADPGLAAAAAAVLGTLARPGDPLRQESALLELLTTLLRRHGTVPLRRVALGGLNPAIRRVREYLHAHLAERVSIADVARVGGLSAFHLIRLFHARTGLPPYMYLEHLRLAEARRLLGRGLPIAEVARRTGFGDQSHFTRRFKRVVGVPPGRYIRQQRGA